MSTYHIPVLADEVIEGLHIEIDGKYIDATFGGGGHTKALLDRGAQVLAIDADPDAIREGKSNTHEKLKLVQGNFRDIGKIAEREHFVPVKGILFDLGVSSHELDTPERGFSYRFDTSPLDMRFSAEGRTAAEYLQTLSTDELYEIFATYGEEERSLDLAHAIVSARSVKKIETTADLKKVIAQITGSGMYQQKMLSRVYQALRIVTNDEMGALKQGLGEAEKILETHGKLAVISFHSLEDRIVKRFFEKEGWKLDTKKPIIASPEEQRINKRSRSAKLRIGEKIVHI